MLTASTDNTVKVWDVCTGKDIATTTKDKSAIKKVLFIEKGDYFITLSKDFLKVWNTEPTTMIACSNMNEVEGIPADVFYNESNRRVVRGISILNSIVKVWDADIQNIICARNEKKMGATIQKFETDPSLTNSGKIALPKPAYNNNNNNNESKVNNNNASKSDDGPRPPAGPPPGVPPSKKPNNNNNNNVPKAPIKKNINFLPVVKFIPGNNNNNNTPVQVDQCDKPFGVKYDTFIFPPPTNPCKAEDIKKEITYNCIIDDLKSSVKEVSMAIREYNRSHEIQTLLEFLHNCGHDSTSIAVLLSLDPKNIKFLDLKLICPILCNILENKDFDTRSESLRWFTLLLEQFLDYILELKQLLYGNPRERAPVDISKEERLEVVKQIINGLKHYKRFTSIISQKDTKDYVNIKAKEFYDLIDIITKDV